MPNTRQSLKLPLRNPINTARRLSIVVAILMGALSLAGLILPTWVYPSEDLVQSFLANDLVNLVIGLPVLLGAIWQSRQGKWIGLLLWPGALLYVVYNYIAYLLGIPFSIITGVYLTIILLSAYILFDLVKSIHHQKVGEQLAGAVSEKITGWVLITFGALFIIRAIGQLANIGSNPSLPAPEIGVLVADMVLSALWLGGGILLLRRMPLGYVSGLGLLFAGCTLFIGLIIFLLLQPLLTSAPFAPIDILVVSLMGLICFVPFGLYVRGVVQKENDI